MDGQTAMRAGNYKLVLNGRLVEGEEQRAEVFLSDLSVDPGEHDNLAEKLPEDPDELVVEAFDSKTASSREMYENARSQAQSADAFIRDYLGTFNK